MAVKIKPIAEGAESKIYEAEIFGVDALVKAREPKPYRAKELDEFLRGSRTRKEARLLLAARRAGASVPSLMSFGRFEIYMQKLDGILLRDILQDSPCNIFEKAGEELAKLHKAGIAHGDYTPANILVKADKVYVIDFGLSEFTNSIEERAIDVLLMKRSISKKQYSCFLKGYAKYSQSTAVLDRLAKIEKRGRYQTRTLSTL